MEEITLSDGVSYPYIEEFTETGVTDTLASFKPKPPPMGARITLTILKKNDTPNPGLAVLQDALT